MTGLEKRVLGRTGFPVTVLGFGAMELRNADRAEARRIDPAEAARVLNGVLDGGINLIDTSPDYGDSEESIGAAIAHRRGEYFLASKCGCPLEVPLNAPRPLIHDYSRKNIVSVLERSLRRLRTDYLDLLQFHASPSWEVLEAEDAISTLIDLRQQGKIRAIGSSSTLPNLVDHISTGAFDTFQIPYSALQREHEDVMTLAARAGAGIVVRGGLARGEPGFGRGDEAVWKEWERAGLDDLLDGASRTAFMLRFTISHTAMSTTIVGTLNPDHLAQNIAAANLGALPQDIYQETQRRLGD